MNVLRMSSLAAVLGAAVMAASPASAWHRDQGHGYGHGYAPPAYGYHYGPPHGGRPHWRHGWRHRHGWHGPRRDWYGSRW